MNKVSSVEQSEDMGWSLRNKIYQLTALLKIVEELECLNTIGTADLEDVRQLIGLASDVAQSAESGIDQFYDAFGSLKDRLLSYPQEGDRLPGELLLDLLKVVSSESASASGIATAASDLANFTDSDQSLKPALEFLMDRIRELGYIPNLVRHQNIGWRVEIRPAQKAGPHGE
ncbi:hypothetical protein [Sedimenticola selenatireducens]|uniref:hypothetical protein n=1 Tax=Sedimenticola selenatireducens TaxID=191960 RepID=UPI00146FB1F2|nr:hypothetical protein [Sedimenticola selenatireducens]